MIKRCLRQYPVTTSLVFITTIFFVTELCMRFALGSGGFADLLLGCGTETGLLPYISFQLPAILRGQVWRLFSWLFCTHGVLEFLAIVCAIALLGASLERWLGSKKMGLLLCNTAVIALLSGYGMALYNNSRPALAGSIYVVCLLAGIALALSFTGGDKPGESFRLKPAAWIMPALLLSGTYCGILLSVYRVYPTQSPDWFFFLYAVSAGAFGGLYFSWQNQTITNHSVFDKTRVLPPYEKIRWKSFPGTLCLLGLIIAISFFEVASVSRQYLIDVYGGAGLGAWLRYIFLSGFFNWRLSETVVNLLGVNIETLLKGQLWRLFTVSLMHGGPLHLLGNGAALYLTGKYIEPRVGTLRWLGVFFASVWAFKLPQIFYTNELLHDGASVGIYALAAIFLLYSFKKGETIRSRPHEFIYLLGYVFIGNFIAFGAGHFVSFVFGLLAAFALRKPRKPVKF